MKEININDIYEQKPKKKVRVRKGRIILLASFFLFLVLDIFLIVEYKARGVDAVGYQFMEKVTDAFESGANMVSSVWEPELKQDGNLTSALIVGIDSRNVEFNGTEFINTKPEGQHGTRNADTIIQIVYDHSNGNIFMISIPRDMGVDVNKECLEFHGSLHWVYDKGQAKNCPGGGVQTLIETVEGVTGVKVHYFAFFTFDAFRDVINAVGDINEKGERGVWIYLEEPVYELYPINDKGWESVYFPQGYQFLTADRALKFARSRKTSTDFGRARRQQKVISAVKDRIMSSETLTNPQKLYSLLQAFKKNTLFSEPSIEEIRAALNLSRDIDTNEIIHIVIDPELGGHEALINKQPHDRRGGPYYMVPTHWKECPGDEFCKVKNYLQNVIKNPDIYFEQATIFVYARKYGSDGKPNLNNPTYQALKANGLPIMLNESKYTANIQGDNDIVVFDFSNGSKPETLEALSKELGVAVVPGSEAPYININKEDIAIVVKGN
ncbi:LCP family protein [Candidatus Dojkabacteria bacterium]|nr:LCP family protein [Candidatus Dojkabacteria bacterium]